MKTTLELEIQSQPDETTCGPTCLQAIYRYHDEAVPLRQIISEVPTLRGGGTLSVMLGLHALERGYRATMYTYDLGMFDPTWFRPDAPDMRARLLEQSQHKTDERLRLASQCYVSFLDKGGVIQLEDLNRALIRKYLNRGLPILTGLNSTYLYRNTRTFGEPMADDDVRGEAVGHFVVLCGYDKEARTVLVADPYGANPYSGNHYYEIDIDRVVCAILLGIMTHDANLLILEKERQKN